MHLIESVNLLKQVKELIIQVDRYTTQAWMNIHFQMFNECRKCRIVLILIKHSKNYVWNYEY